MELIGQIELLFVAQQPLQIEGGDGGIGGNGST
jgi:hypothetical protein